MDPPITSRPALQSFPFLTPDEFQQTCAALVNCVEATGGPGPIGWHLMDLQQPGGIDVLRIVKRIQLDGVMDNDTHAQENDNVEPDGDEFAQLDDPEALARQPGSTAQVEVEYNIIRSSTYQLPVLYFFLRGLPPHGPQGIDAVYRYLVPTQLIETLKTVGVMGGISIDYHPTLGLPVYFVHPCNTADALRDVGDGRVPTIENYLPLWLGLAGNCVNLYLPSELLAGTNGKKT